mgnify:CR=1 FL=1
MVCFLEEKGVIKMAKYPKPKQYKSKRKGKSYGTNLNHAYKEMKIPVPTARFKSDKVVQSWINLVRGK